MNTYIVVERPQDAEIMRIILPAHILHNVRLIIGGSRSSSISLARSLISDRGEPLLLIVDSDTVNREAVAEQEIELRELLGAVSIDTPFEVIMAVPQLEVVFFHDVTNLAGVLDLPMDHAIEISGTYAPRQALNELIERSPHKMSDNSQFLQSLDESARNRIAQHPLIQRIAAFVTNSVAIPAV